MRNNHSKSFNSWSHPFWKYGCLLPIVILVAILIISAVIETFTNGGNSIDHVSERIDSLRNSTTNLSFEDIALGETINPKNFVKQKLECQNYPPDSASHHLKHKDYLYNSASLTSKQDIYIYTTNEGFVYKIVITMPNDDVYTDAFFEKYNIELATKDEKPNSIIYKWEWSNQSLSLDIPKGGLDLTIIYFDKNGNILHNEEVKRQHNEELNDLYKEKEDITTKI